MRSLCQIFWVALLLPGLATVAFGQARNLDYTKRASGLEAKRFETETRTPVLNERLQNKRFRTDTLSPEMARINAKDTARGFGEMYRVSEYPTSNYRGPGMTPIEFFRRDGQMAQGLSDAGVLWQNTVALRFQKVYNHMLEQEISRLEGAKDRELSLRDINRYQFQRSRENGAVVPVQQAGGG